jgi:hypothetical protein
MIRIEMRHFIRLTNTFSKKIKSHAHERIDVGNVYRFASVAASCIAVAACAYMQINDELTPLKGQPVSAAIAKLGPPTEERTVAGQKNYISVRENDDDGLEQECNIRAIMKGDVIETFKF